jgi:hypothetical protein
MSSRCGTDHGSSPRRPGGPVTGLAVARPVIRATSAKTGTCDWSAPPAGNQLAQREHRVAGPGRQGCLRAQPQHLGTFGACPTVARNSATGPRTVSSIRRDRPERRPVMRQALTKRRLAPDSARRRQAGRLDDDCCRPSGAVREPRACDLGDAWVSRVGPLRSRRACRPAGRRTGRPRYGHHAGLAVVADHVVRRPPCLRPRRLELTAPAA